MLENYGGSLGQTSVHTPDDTTAGTYFTKYANTSVDDGWHIWRMWWNPKTGGFTFYKDGVEYLTVAPTEITNWCFSSGVPMFMLLNLAIGGQAGPPHDSVRFPIDLLVDYVRVW